jgi:hypothetical protein
MLSQVPGDERTDGSDAKKVKMPESGTAGMLKMTPTKVMTTTTNITLNIAPKKMEATEKRHGPDEVLHHEGAEQRHHERHNRDVE